MLQVVPTVKFLVAAVLLVALAQSTELAHAADLSSPSRFERDEPRFERVLTVVFENADYEEALSQPFMAALARRGGLLTHFSAETHPSQPNYIAMVAGSTEDVATDRKVTLDVRHVGDLLEDAGLQWKVYAEGYPGDCFLGARSGEYVRKHVPFLSFLDVQTDAARCARIVAASTLDEDIRHGTLPSYSFYIPDLKNDGHDTDVTSADAWLSRRFGPLLQDSRFTKGLLLVVTFDEDAGILPFPNHVLTILVGDSVAPGSQSDRSYNHYSLLRLIEDQFELGNLGKQDAAASRITDVWRRAAAPPIARASRGGP